MVAAFWLLNSPDFQAWWSGPTIQSSLPRDPSTGPRLDQATPSTQRTSTSVAPSTQRTGSRLALDVPEESVEARVIRYIESTRPLSTTDWFELDRLTFQTASNALTTASMVQVLNIAAILNAYPTVRLKIGGYTDNVGDPAANLRLSDARANTVMRELVSLGIAPERLTAEGYGEQHPIADNATAEGRARNRRIAFRVTQR